MQYCTIPGFSISAVDLFQSLCSIDTIIRKVWHLNDLNVLQLVSYLVWLMVNRNVWYLDEQMGLELVSYFRCMMAHFLLSSNRIEIKTVFVEFILDRFCPFLAAFISIENVGDPSRFDWRTFRIVQKFIFMSGSVIE